MAVTVQTMRERINVEGFADIPREIRIVFTAEVDEQARRGLKPTLVLVDNGSTQQLVSVKRRARAFYGADSARIAQAMQVAWDALVTQTRVKTGRARQSFALYFRGVPVGGRGDIERIAKMMTERDTLQIVGPGVAYGRKLYWRPAGRQRIVKRVRTSRAGVRGGVRLKVRSSYTEPMFRAVVRMLRRRFPDLYSSDAWRELRHGAGPHGQRWPALAVGMRFNRTSLH
ncbi:MAG TPA: hypothetical protein VMS92_00475 [Mycobacterium sp.]|nr:hypothetical protein [Mycobacterium sp.]